ERQHQDRIRARPLLAKKLSLRMGARYAPGVVSLDNYLVEHPGQQQTLNKVKAIAARLPDAVVHGENIVLYGTPGTGKDHLLAALLYIAIENDIRVSWFNGDTLQRKQDIDVALFRADGASILAISDPMPPADEPCERAVNALFRLVDARYRHQHPTWLTVNAR